MSSQTIYERWLKLRKQISKALTEDEKLQDLAKNLIGLKPQSLAIEVVARVYSQYCEIFNNLCECYDLMPQAQRRLAIKKVLDALSCRLMELKVAFQDVEFLEFTYPDNALQQLIMIPQQIEVLCPFHYPLEIRQKEMQYVIDEIMSGNRLGDPEPTPSELERKEQERLEEEERIREEKEAEIRRKMAMGEEIIDSEQSVVYSPQELEEMRFHAEYFGHLHNIQRMERARTVTLEKNRKALRNANLYLELAGTKTPLPRDEITSNAAKLIQKIYRTVMVLKREKYREDKVKERLGMVMPSWSPPSHKIEMERVRAKRREIRQAYYEKWLAANLKEHDRVLRLRENDMFEDISVEVREWFRTWYKKNRVFDEYPWPDEGGSILIARGETMPIQDYLEWEKAEKKRLKSESENPKTSEDIKAEKKQAKEDARRAALDEKIRNEKILNNYKKSRLNPANDPGKYVTIGHTLEPLLEDWFEYDVNWTEFDARHPTPDMIKGYFSHLLTEEAYYDTHLKVRVNVDVMMRLELKMLNAALKNDLRAVGIMTMPLTEKRKKPKKPPKQKPDKTNPAALFQNLVDHGIIKKYPRVTLEEYWGDRNYAAADTRAIPWTPTFSQPCYGDVREQVRIQCLIPLGSSCQNAVKSHLLVGPKSAGKKTLIHAIATESNSIIVDLSPSNIFQKYQGKEQKKLYLYVNKIARLMQPTIIMVENADKMCYKKVPKEEKETDPTRLAKDFFKEFVKPIKPEDKILIMGTATEPWLAKGAILSKIFSGTILLPQTDYASISFLLTQLLMKYHGVDREFDVHSVAQVARGFDLDTVRKAVESVLQPDRVATLQSCPLQPHELVTAILQRREGVLTDKAAYDMYTQWYLSYSPWGKTCQEYIFMLDSQYQMKLKEDKKKK